MMTKEDLQAIREMMKEELQPIKDDIEIIKEDVAITRAATNTLLKWADDQSIQIIPLSKAK